MAAYAGVASLMNTMEHVRNQPRLSSYSDGKQRESLWEIAAFLMDFIERELDSHGGMSKEEAEGLESAIASAAHKAEDAIEFHITHQIQESSSNLLDLQQVIKDMDSVKEKVMEKWRCNEEQPTYSTLSRAVDAGKSSTVEFEDDIRTQLMEMLAGQSSARQVVSIVGMGGIGKTTLARNAYESALIVQHFDVRAWAAVSQQCDEHRVLKELFTCRKKSAVGSIDELGEKLYKELCGRRYLIALDDVWSAEVWDKINVYFPDNGNGSRIVMTSRRSSLSVNFPGSSVFEMKFLDEKQSWELLREKAFGSQEHCPPELEKIGKKIAKKCGGLPLSIVVIGGLLWKSNKSEKSWKKVAENISSILRSGEDEQCMNVLYLSYSEMPPHLKPCFLYMGVFPEDEEICASKLVKLWAGEGFLKPNEAQSLEEVGECCLKELIERNLILVHKWALNRKVKTCGVHDLLRELCLSVAKKERFFLDMRVPNATPQGVVKECCRVVVQGRRDRNAINDCAGSSSLVRSLTLDGGPLPPTFPLLRVLSNVTDGSLKNVTKQVNLRYLCQKITESSILELPTSMSLLWNLQTIKIEGGAELKIDASFKIWEMRQLRHLETDVHIYVPDPPRSEDGFVLQNLQTLVDVKKFRLSDDVCRRIPNIKKLHIRYPKFSNKYCLNNLHQLQNLQTLNFYISDNGRRDDLVKNLAFPTSLRRLSLRGCRLRWDDITQIGFSLPRLEILKLKRDAVGGNDWLPLEGAFPSLKLLRLNRLDLVNWAADSSHFPVLEEMFLRRLDELDEIPLDMVEIPTLKYIRLEDCSSSASVSSVRILEEELSFGNEEFRVWISWNKTDIKRFLEEEVDIGSFSPKNFLYKKYI